MSHLTVDFIISLDGYAAADGWPGYWGMEGPEYLAWIKGDAENEPTALLRFPAPPYCTCRTISLDGPRRAAPPVEPATRRGWCAVDVGCQWMCEPPLTS